MVKAKDIMTREPICVETSSNIREVIDKMLSHHIRHIPVVKNNRVVGIVSDRDVHSYVLPSEDSIEDLWDASRRLRESVEKIANNGVITVFPDTDIVEILDIFVAEKIGAVPVVEPSTDVLVGIVSYIDILTAAREKF